MRTWHKTTFLDLPPCDEPRVYYPIFGKVVTGKTHFNSIVKSGNTINPVLVETPDRPGAFLTPLELPEPYAEEFFRRAQSARRKVLIIAGFYLTISLGLALMFRDMIKPIMVMVSSLSAIILYLVIDNQQGFNDKLALKERIRFFGWLFVASRCYIAIIIALFLATGLVQFILGEARFLEDFALLFDLPAGEEWRYLTGSLIHSRVAHWLTNFAIGVGIAAVCGPTLRLYFLPVFIIGGVLSFMVTLWTVNLVGIAEHDGLVGTSGGLSALLGCQLALMIRHRESYPKGFYLNVGFFFAISCVVGTVFLSVVSVICHVSGALAGALMSLVVPNYLEIPDDGDPSLRSG